MLVIRLQRTGRRGHAQYRVVVQDSRFSPTSGRVVAYVGNYNPHSKEAKLDADKIKTYLAAGAQPSPRVVSLLKADKIKLPSWVEKAAKKKGAVRNPQKRRSTAPKEESPSDSTAQAEAPAKESLAESPPAEAAEPTTEAAAEAPVEPAPEEKPAEEATQAEDGEKSAKDS